MKNVVLLCMSLLNSERPVKAYNYYPFRDAQEKDCVVKGRMTNEAPVKSVIYRLNKDHGRRLDRIVMICSKKVQNTPIGKLTDPSDDEKKLLSEFKHKDESSGNRLPTHLEYFEWMINYYAQKINNCYKSQKIDFVKISISDFAKETEVIKAVIDSAEKAKEEYNDINLYIDFNGGPRNVAVLIVGLANLMKLRNVTVKEILYMDFENAVEKKEKEGDKTVKKEKEGSKIVKKEKEKGKEKEWVKIVKMETLFSFVELVSGVNEYVNYGRIHILKEYFKTCDNQKIKMILGVLEDFSNNMQLCLTDYVMENKEKVKNALNTYQSSPDTESSFEIMFSFVAEDILRGCQRLLEGSLPEMILWCVEKEFIQQALTFYLELIPAYLWDKKIFCPVMAEQQAYAEWRIDCAYNLNDIPNTYHDFSCHMDDKYYWMHYYLLKDMPKEEISRQETADMTVTDRYDICRITGCNIAEAGQKAEYMLSLLNPDRNRASTSVDTDILRQILTEYYLIHNQRISSRRSITQLGASGNLWNYQEMQEALKMAANRLKNL